MKQLTLIRHGTAEPALGGQPDWDRALEARGIRDAQKMGKHLRGKHAKPDLFLSSPAVRALVTAQHIAHELGLPPTSIQKRERLYLASPKDLLALLCELGGTAQQLWLVGHNPGISEFADRLSSERRIDNMPTCAIVQMEFDFQEWRDLGWGLGVNVEFEYPQRC
jgi:phosphohistidine phosphatase